MVAIFESAFREICLGFPQRSCKSHQPLQPPYRPAPCVCVCVCVCVPLWLTGFDICGFSRRFQAGSRLLRNQCHQTLVLVLFDFFFFSLPHHLPSPLLTLATDLAQVCDPSVLHFMQRSKKAQHLHKRLCMSLISASSAMTTTNPFQKNKNRFIFFLCVDVWR